MSLNCLFFLLKQMDILLIKDSFYILSIYKVEIFKFCNYTANTLHTVFFCYSLSHTEYSICNIQSQYYV